MRQIRHEVTSSRRDYEGVQQAGPLDPEATTALDASLDAADEQVQVVVDPYAERRRTIHKLTQGIYLLFGVIEGLTAIRFALLLLGANPGAPFAAFIYAITAPFVAPFAGIFPEFQSQGNVMEPHAIVAILVYALLAWFLVQLVWLVWGETRSGVSTSTRRIRSRLP